MEFSVRGSPNIPVDAPHEASPPTCGPGKRTEDLKAMRSTIEEAGAFSWTGAREPLVWRIDIGIRRCSVHGAKLWPKPKVRPIRFHDLRHTTAS